MILEELGKFLGGELASTGVEENDGVGGAGAGFFAEFQEGGFVGEGEAFDVGVTGDSLEVFGGQGLDGGVFRFADPDYFQFHLGDLTTEDTEVHGGPPKPFTAKVSKNCR